MTTFFDTIIMYIIERGSEWGRMDNSKMKKIIIFVLIVAIFIMSSVYAILYQELRIHGNASVIASWKVGITGIKEGTKTGNATSISVPNYTLSTATFSAQLQDSSDSIEYVVTIENSGRIDAKLNDITTSNDGSSAIIYELSGVAENDVLKAGESIDVTIKVKVDSSVTNIDKTLNSSVTIIFNYVQNV